MVLALVGGAALGAVFGELLNEILEVKDNAGKFKPKLEQLEATLEELRPVIEDIEELNKRLNYQNETKYLMRLMEDGKKLVSKCSKIGWFNFPKKSRYHKKLLELDNNILRFHNLHLQANMARDVKTLLYIQAPTLLLPRNLGHPNELTIHNTASRTIGHDEIKINSLILKVEFKAHGYRTEIRSIEGVALELAGGALGRVFGELVNAVEGMNNKALMFRTEMKQLGNTLQLLAPLLIEIEEYNKQLNRPGQSETEILIKLMQEGKELVHKCSKIGRWNVRKSRYYREKLVALDNSLLRFMVDHTLMGRDMRQIFPAVKGIMSSPPHNLGHPIELTMHSTASLTFGHDKIKINSVILKVEFETHVYRTEIRSIEGAVVVACIDKVKRQETVRQVSDHTITEWITMLFDKTEWYANIVHQFLETKDKKKGRGCILRFDDLKIFLWDISTTVFRLPNHAGGVLTSISVEVFSERRSTDGFNSSPVVGSRNSITQLYKSPSEEDAWRILERDETDVNDSRKSGNSRHSFERLALTPPPALHETTSGAEHSSNSAAKLNLLILAIVLLFCFNLATFLILLYK